MNEYELWDFIHYHIDVLLFYIIGLFQGIVLIVYEKKILTLITISAILTIIAILGMFQHLGVAVHMLETIK